MKLSTTQLIGIGGHIGYSVREWSPLSERYLIGYRHGIAIFDLAQSSFYLRRAFHFIENAIARYSRGFFYGFSQPDSAKFRPLAQFGQVVSVGRWGGGFLTNLRAFRRRVLNANRVPGFLVCFRFEPQNYSALREKARLHLPLVCPVDSNTGTGYVEYPIPGNAGGRANAGYFGAIFSRAVFSGVSGRVRRIALVAHHVRARRRAVRSNNLALAAQLQRRQSGRTGTYNRFSRMKSGLGGSGIGPLR